MFINTNRLKLVPMTLDLIHQSISNKGAVLDELGIKSNNRLLSNVIQKIYQIKFDNIMKDMDNYLFYTYWMILLKKDNSLLGEIGFKGMPNEKGEIEVGYGTEEDHRNKGYMTEALQGLTEWTFGQTMVDIAAIIANTNANNIPSHRVLEKAGFLKTKVNKDSIWWKLEKVEGENNAKENI